LWKISNTSSPWAIVVGNEARVAIAHELVSRNQLDGTAFEEPAMEWNPSKSSIAGILQDTMASILGRTIELRYLLLINAGRCFGPKAVQALRNPKRTPRTTRNNNSVVCPLAVRIC